ncbi:hypothetical protein [Clostridium sartagoforme]|uniref:hypothetical protein n=1 Tax=Clostridium sartagoforme TaxID=84031 RepID=UPI001FA6D070|nr:hypothetical protein [Clostridium sartagoforme]
MYDIILMDIDNTILDFNVAERDSFKEVIEEIGLSYTDDLLRQYQKLTNLYGIALSKVKFPKKLFLILALMSFLSFMVSKLMVKK